MKNITMRSAGGDLSSQDMRNDVPSPSKRSYFLPSFALPAWGARQRISTQRRGGGGRVDDMTPLE